MAENFGYTPLDIGMAKGIFQRHDVEITLLNFTGGAKIAQAMAAGSVDISLSAGPDMQFVAKGAPEIAIASITESPVFMGLCISKESPVKTIDDLKGQQVGIASLGSLTYWLIDELNRVKGWTGDDRAKQVVVGGSTAASLAALKTKQVAASLSATQTGFLLEERGEGRLARRLLAICRAVRALHHLRRHRDHAKESGCRAALPRRLVRDRRFHAQEQGRDDPARRQGDDLSAQSRGPRL